jgi:hypothetical protein
MQFKDFQEQHIDIVWEELRVRFGFDIKAWRTEFSLYLGTQPRNVDVVDAFIVFGNKKINPVLNMILVRRDLHPTFNKLVLYILNR